MHFSVQHILSNHQLVTVRVPIVARRNVHNGRSTRVPVAGEVKKIL